MKHKKLTAIVLALAMLFGLMPAKVLDNTVYAAGGITLTPIKANPSQQEAEQIVKTLFPDNSPILNKVSNIKINYTGNVNNQISTFSNAKDGGVLTFNEGIALSTGNLKKDLNASNTAKGITGSYNSSVSNESINGDRLYDPCSIEFDINMDVEGSMVLQYAFGSDEYTEYSTGNFNDKFGVIVNNDVNYAVVPGSNPPEYIAINTINQTKNTEFFIDNTDKHLPIELDGITKTFSNGAKLKKGNNHVKIIIGDKGDSTYDSVLFIKAKSFQLKENKPGVLSLAKNGNNLVIKRTNGTDGTVAFTLVEYDLNGLETKLAYSLNDGESEITIPISQNASEDAPNKIAFNTAKVHIKDAKMGATIDTAKDKLTLKIAAPVLTITGTNNDQISIKGLPGATVVVTKEDGTIQNVTLDGSGNGVLTSPQAAGTYTATQTKDTFTSANSNKVIIKKPPIITSTVPKAFDEVIVEQNKTAVAKPYDVTALNVSAQTSNGNPINSPHFTVEIPNEIKNDTKIPGIYTIKWTATDSGFTAVKTKVVKVKPAMPELFYDDYKHSVIFVEGESNAVVHIKDNNNNIVDTIHLDASGEGKLVNPPNGNYGASQIVNGVESEEVRTLTINRTYKHPEITLKDQTIIEGEFTLDANTYSYTEPGAKVSDEEDNKRPVDLSDPHGAKEWDAVNEVNTFLTPKVEIDNPMFSKDGKNQKITITPPALDKQGDPTNSNNSPFQPFVGKYEIKYNVKDTDDLAATPVIRLVRVRPYKPEVSVDTTNEDSSIKIDALSTASIFLYKEINGEYQPVNIVGGEAELVTDPDNYLDPSRTKLKMPELTNLYDHIEKKMTGLPDGDYKVVQRLYGLSSDLSDKITVLHDVYSPLVKLNGNAVVNIVKDSNYVDDGATVTIGTDPTIDFDETNPNHILDNKVEADKVGIYKVKYEVKHSAGGTSKKGSAERTVVVKPPMPQYEIGDYADFNGDGHKTFKKNSNGNDLKVTGILDGASVQLVKGKDGNGALYKQEFNVNGGEHVFENLVQTEGSTSATDNADDYGIFQTVSEIQSAKNSPFEISKTNTKPKLSFDDEEAVQVIKGESKSISKDEASATDEEDDDDKLTERIRIYTEYEEKDGVIKPKGTAKENISIDTNTVGVKEFYYAVTDTDGNTVMKHRTVDVMPKAPKITVNGKTSITAGELEKNAIVELFKQDDNGKWVLFDTQKANASGNDITFNNLDTGLYKLEQVAEGLESEKSDAKAFANPAYIITRVVDKDNNIIAGVKFDVTEHDGSHKKAETDENGKLLLGVDSAGYLYELNLSDDNVFVMATSSESSTDLSTTTSVVGALATDGRPSNMDEDKIVAKVQKKNAGKWEESHVAKLVYKHGDYQLIGIKNGVQYKVNVNFDLGEKGELAISEFITQVNSDKNIMIANQELNYGKVTDKSGNALSGVKVTVYHPDRDKMPDYELGAVDLPQVNGIKGSNINGSLTDGKGEYGYSVYNNDPYVLVFEKNGYKDQYKLVENVNGNLLGVDVTMEKGSSSNNSSSHSNKKKKKKHKDDDSDEKDYKISDKKKDVEKVKDEVSKPKEDNGLDIIEDIKPNSILDGNKKDGDTYVNKNDDRVKDGSYLAYESKNKDGDDKITEEPKKGKLFTNPASGSMIYIPAKNEEGRDSFVIETKDAKGKSIKVKKNINIEKQSGKLYGRRNALVLEINSDNRKGFHGSEFDFGLKYKNDLNKDVKDATIAVKVPDGFKYDGAKYKVKNGHIIVPVKNIKQGETSTLDFKLTAVNPEANISEIKAVLQENGSERIYPEAVSSLDVSVSKLNTEYLVKPYVKGYPDGGFDKEALVTRAEVAAMLTRCFKNDNKKPMNMAKKTFTDVPDYEWYVDYIDQAVSYGLFNGYEDGTFKPDKKITRAELASVIGNYLKLDISNAGVIEQPYTDVEEHWARDDVNALNRYGISIGYEDGTFKPDQEISREETVRMINNMLYRYTLPDVKSSFNDMNKTDWSYGDIESAYRGYSFEMDSNRNLSIKEMN